MQKVFAYIGVLVVGVVIGCLLPDYHFGGVAGKVQRDTVVRYDTIRYSRLELEAESHLLNVPKINVPKLAFLDVEKVDTVYKDNVMYLTYPRENYYTRTEDAEIWHSGIDSTIDSLNVVRKTQNITETIQKRDMKNAISIGVNGSYYGSFMAPVYLEYRRRLRPWISLYGRFGYDIPSGNYGVCAGAEITISW